MAVPGRPQGLAPGRIRHPRPRRRGPRWCAFAAPPPPTASAWTVDTPSGGHHTPAPSSSELTGPAWGSWNWAENGSGGALGAHDLVDDAALGRRDGQARRVGHHVVQPGVQPDEHGCALVDPAGDPHRVRGDEAVGEVRVALRDVGGDPGPFGRARVVAPGGLVVGAVKRQRAAGVICQRPGQCDVGGHRPPRPEMRGVVAGPVPDGQDRQPGQVDAGQPLDRE